MNELIAKIKQRIRVASDTSNDEIMDLIEACKRELEIAGVYGDELDPTYYQAIVLYCKGHFGYDDDTDKFILAFEKLRDAMSLSGDYSVKEGEA